MRMTVLVGALMLFAACAGDPADEAAGTASDLTAVPTTTTSTITTMVEPETTTTFAPGIASAEEYLLDAIDFAEANALFKDRVDWDAQRSEAVVVARDARSPTQLHMFIDGMLGELGDNHSHFWSPSSHRRFEEGALVTSASVRIIDDRLGYIAIDGFDGGEDHIGTYAAETQEAIGAIADDVCGWVVDLRSNGGGNEAAMLGGLGPLLERSGADADALQGVVGYYIHPDGVRQTWRYLEGTLRVDDWVVLTVAKPSVLDEPDPPTAVLIGGQTRSAGEFTLIALMGQPNTRSFGWSTYGVPTANLLHLLSDDASMAVTAAQYAGLDAVPYHPTTPIEPDETGGGTEHATSWLLAQPGCHGTDQ